MKFFRIAAIAVIISCSSDFVYSQSSCTTPNGESARCIALRSCTILYNALTTQDSQQKNFLRESQCGYTTGPLVCCGTANNYQRSNSNNRPPTNGGVSDRRRGSSHIDKENCGSQLSNRILDGEKTGLDEFPWMALLQYRKSNGKLTFSCGGSLISSRYVLTAAHCVTGKILTRIGPLVNVRLGEWNTDTIDDCVSNEYNIEICSDDPVDVGVEETLYHNDYSDSNVNRYNDIALVRMNREVKFTDFIRAICLPDSNQRPEVGSGLYVAGWGKTENASSSATKLKLRVPIAATGQCSARFRTAGVTIGSSQICAGGEKGRDSCNGDSGGPLMNVKPNSVRWYVEGIVSFGAKCGSQGWPGIYTRVVEFVDWIEDNVKA